MKKVDYFKMGYKNGYEGTKKRADVSWGVEDRYQFTAGYLTGGNDYNDEFNAKAK